MIGFIIRYIIIACVVLIIPRYLKGITVDGFGTALIVALAMGFLNSFVKPILKIISFPITFMTLGLFSLVITVALVYIVEAYVEGFKVTGFVAPLIFSFVVGITNSFVGLFTK
ncbi:phage holin family protein [Aquirufa sp. 5-AUSEE-100C1]